MSTFAQQQRLGGTSFVEQESSGPAGENVCLICGWSGGPLQMVVHDGEKLWCPNCLGNGKIEGRKEFLDREYMLGRYTRQSVADWKMMRKKLGITAPQWLVDKQAAIVNCRARGDQL